METSNLKGIFLGSAFAVGIGFIYYIASNFYFAFTAPRASVDEIMLMFDTHQIGLGRLSSFVIMMIAGYLTAKLSASHVYISSLILAGIVSLSILSIPFHVYSIHMNFIIVTTGSLLGAFLHSKRTKNLTNRSSKDAQGASLS
jgi:hypothetical protein